MATDVFIINPAVGIRNGEVVCLPQPGQVGLAGTTNQGSGGFVLSYPVAEPDRVQTVASADTAQMQAGYRFRGELRKQAVPMSPNDTASASGADVVLHLPAAGPGFSHVIEGFTFSYAQTPSGVGSIYIQDGSGNTVWRQAVTQSGPGEIHFNPERRGSPNTDLFIILSNGGAGVSGDVSLLGHWLI